MTISHIAKVDVRLASMIIGYKIYHSSRFFYLSGTVIYAAYEMIKQNVDYDLCEVLRGKLLENLKKIKKDKKNVFKFENLLVYLYFYFLDEVPRFGQVQWGNDVLIAV